MGRTAQQIETHRMLRSRRHHQGAGLGDASEGAGDRDLVRCLATHANPSTGERDRDVMNTLVRAFGQEQPTFAVSLRALAPGC